MYLIFVIITIIFKCLFIFTFDILPATRVDLHWFEYMLSEVLWMWSVTVLCTILYSSCSRKNVHWMFIKFMMLNFDISDTDFSHTTDMSKWFLLITYFLLISRMLGFLEVCIQSQLLRNSEVWLNNSLGESNYSSSKQIVYWFTSYNYMYLF